MKKQRKARQKKTPKAPVALFDVAANPKTSGLELKNLLASWPWYTDLRIRIALNPNTLNETLKELAVDPNPFVRVALLRNPKVPFDILKQLSQDADDYVRFRFASTIIDMYVRTELSIDKRELIPLIQSAMVYKTKLDNFDLIDLIDNIENERDHQLYNYYYNTGDSNV